jgi:hypothetical protein
MARRYYSSIAQRTTLAASVDGTTTTFIVDAVVGWPSSFPYTLLIDEDTINEEIVEVTGRSSTTLTVVRGLDGTAGTSHSAGASVRHGVSGRDFDEPNSHVNSSSNVHGISGSVVGTTDTQTLSSKTLNNTTFTGTITGLDVGPNPFFLIGA